MKRPNFNIPKTIDFNNAKLFYRNFSGREKKDPKTGKIVNPEGKRNFNIIIEDPALLQMMSSTEEPLWNLKALISEEGDAAMYHLPVEVRYDKIPPNIFRESSSGQHRLTEETVGNLDFETIISSDVQISTSIWFDDKVNLWKVKAYASIAHFNVVTDPWEQKYGVQQ